MPTTTTPLTAAEAETIVLGHSLSAIDRAFGRVIVKPYTPHPRLAEAVAIHEQNRLARILAYRPTVSDGAGEWDDLAQRREHGTHRAYRGEVA